MTEREWLECADLGAMLEFGIRGMSYRKIRLFACACGRRIARSSTSDSQERIIHAAERYADDEATSNELAGAFGDAFVVMGDLEEFDDGYERLLAHSDPIPVTVLRELIHGPIRAATANCATYTAVANIRGKELGHVAAVLRCLVGNPFHCITAVPCWLNPTVVSLGRTAYEERIQPSGDLDPDRLAVLSDALEEAGCDDADILNHLRSPGPHVRGCWVVDLLLGKV